MKAAKQTLIICWIITIISFVGIVVLHQNFDIWMYEQITKKVQTYDDSERAFYQGIWSNIFTGAIVSVFTTYVTYRHAKHALEFQLTSNESIMAMYFDSLGNGTYLINQIGSDKNQWEIYSYKKAIETIKLCDAQLIEATNDYCPFFMTKKSKFLLYANEFLWKLWTEICPAEIYLMYYDDEAAIKQSMESTQAIIKEHKEEFDKIYAYFWKDKR